MRATVHGAQIQRKRIRGTARRRQPRLQGCTVGESNNTEVEQRAARLMRVHLVL
jgi:hypothetical protein